MSWTSKKHIAKIFNAFKRNKERIYKEDIEALKELDEIVNQSSRQLAKDNLIYAKLLCLFLRQNIHYYKDVKMALKQLQFQLKTPLDTQLEMLTIDLNMVDLQNQETDEQLLNKLLNSWTREQVEKSFYNSANDLLKEIENYT
tara:strand:- start:6101 stop:6529 length:429 start_codon:yes stop_codon:yes gene_type:complete